ncbi:putative quinol monooxygenase [Paenibacillus sp. GCM10023252]|uniref:putative quinol monooxygenase n=1 Tax=Paenibacillus sp. GCM10023252 TaxID=3252649 RepID=UPI0036110767
MSVKFGLIGKFTAQAGKRDALADLLLTAAEELKEVEGCDLYVVSISDEEPDAIWITEVWSSAEAHAQSLTMEDTQSLIAQARPLIAGMEHTKLQTLGGKGA